MSVAGLSRDRRDMDSSRDATMYFHLYNKHSKMHVEVKGKIPYANSTKETNYTKLEAESRPVGNNRMGKPGIVAFTLMGKQAGRFLCFTRKGKLITRFMWNNSTCLFEEVLTDDGFYEFHLFDDPSWKLSFNHRGKPLQQATSQPMRHTESSTKFVERGREPTLHHRMARPGPFHSSDTLADTVRKKDFQEMPERRLTAIAHSRRRRWANTDLNVGTLATNLTQQAFQNRSSATEIPQIPRILRTLRLSKPPK